MVFNTCGCIKGQAGEPMIYSDEESCVRAGRESGFYEREINARVRGFCDGFCVRGECVLVCVCVQSGLVTYGK